MLSTQRSCAAPHRLASRAVVEGPAGALRPYLRGTAGPRCHGGSQATAGCLAAGAAAVSSGCARPLPMGPFCGSPRMQRPCSQSSLRWCATCCCRLGGTAVACAIPPMHACMPASCPCCCATIKGRAPAHAHAIVPMAMEVPVAGCMHSILHTDGQAPAPWLVASISDGPLPMCLLMASS